MAEAFDDLREFIAYRVREGFESAHEIVEDAHDWAYAKYERDDLLPSWGGTAGHPIVVEDMAWRRRRQ